MAWKLRGSGAISVMDKVCQIAEKERKTISGFIREIVTKEMNKYEWGK